MKFVLSTVLGGLAVFVWSFLSHVILPLGEMGLQSLPNEEAVLETLHASLPEAGLYYFPGMDETKPSSEAQAAWEAKYRTGPTGLLAYRPIGGEPFDFSQLLIELLKTILAAGVVAFLVGQMTAPFGTRVLSVGMLGLFSWLSISVSYWNWYGFSGAFCFAEGIDQVVGWLLGGLVIAKFASRRQ